MSEGDDVKLKPAMVELVKALDARGIVNSICSKNDEAVAIAKLKELGIEDYFVFPQIDWGPKSDSLKRLAQEMNIGLDAVGFVDDREENLNEVRENAPQVRVWNAGETAKLLDCLNGPDCSNEAQAGLGSRRRVMYREEMARRGAAKAFAGDADAFLAQSGLEVKLLPVEGDCAARCLELVNRTNQLTITGRRYTAESFRQLCACAETAAVQVWDKYGDYGIVGFVAWDGEKVRGGDGERGRILELVVSCRVARKGVERRVLEMLPKGLAIEVVETARNAPIRQIVADWQAGREGR